MSLRDKVHVKDTTGNINITVIHKDKSTDKYIVKENTGAVTKYTSNKD